MDHFFNNGPKILKLIVRVCILYTIYLDKKYCLFENLIFKIFSLDIYRSQTDYSNT